MFCTSLVPSPRFVWLHLRSCNRIKRGPGSEAIVLYHFIAETLLCMHYPLVTRVAANVDNGHCHWYVVLQHFDMCMTICHVIRVICLKIQMYCFLSKLCTMLATLVSWLVDEQIFRDSSWHVTMSNPYYDSHVRYHNQQNIVPLQKL